MKLNPTWLKGKVVNMSFDPEFDNKFYKALKGLENNISHREKEILQFVDEIVITENNYPNGEKYLVAEVFDTQQNGFDFMVEYTPPKEGGAIKHRPGAITS